MLVRARGIPRMSLENPAIDQSQIGSGVSARLGPDGKPVTLIDSKKKEEKERWRAQGPHSDPSVFHANSPRFERSKTISRGRALVTVPR